MLKVTSALSLGMGLLLVGLFACDPQTVEPTDRFDRKAMLQNYADKLIVPAYGNLQTRIDLMHSYAVSLQTTRTPAVLAQFQEAWREVYADWQYANAYNFGPAGEAGLRKGLIEEIGTFPVNKIAIEESIALAQWNFDDFKRDTRGFLAVEYLVFGENQTADEILAMFEMYPQRRNYLVALTEHIKVRTSEVLTAWNGTYRAEFIENDGTDVGSSTALLYNEFVRSYESIKNFKLGLPLGKRIGQTHTEPKLVEALYSEQSLEAMKTHLAAVEDIWHGRDKNGVDGIGFREYLQSVEGGNELIASTEAQLSALKTALAAVPESPSLSAQIGGDLTVLDALYVEFSKMTRFFKSDMSSLLGIAITYSSGDGD